MTDLSLSATEEFLQGIRLGFIDESFGIVGNEDCLDPSSPRAKGFAYGRKLWRKAEASVLVVDREGIGACNGS
jgi:hypothetical protein